RASLPMATCIPRSIWAEPTSWGSWRARSTRWSRGSATAARRLFARWSPSSNHWTKAQASPDRTSRQVALVLLKQQTESAHHPYHAFERCGQVEKQCLVPGRQLLLAFQVTFPEVSNHLATVRTQFRKQVGIPGLQAGSCFRGHAQKKIEPLEDVPGKSGEPGR